MRDQKRRKIAGARTKESHVLWHRSDTFHGKTKERKDRRVISHQTGKLSASKAGSNTAALQKFFIRLVRCKTGRKRLWVAAADLLLMVSP